MALAYAVAELWHGASRRTWLLARVSAAVALMGPVILWLLRQPLCALANVDAVNPDSQACSGGAGSLGPTIAAAFVGVSLVIAVVLVIFGLVDLLRRRSDGRPLGRSTVAPLAGAGALLVLAVLATRLIPEGDPISVIQEVVPELFFALLAPPLLLVAFAVVSARDARRFAIGIVAVAAAWFVMLYPNISALPLPAWFTNSYQLLLPTYPYPFQFSVNTTARTGAISFADPRFVILIAFLAIACAVVAYAAWVWRAALLEERGPGAEHAGDADASDGGPDAADGGSGPDASGGPGAPTAPSSA
jgi:hypothetical protein